MFVCFNFIINIQSFIPRVNLLYSSPESIRILSGFVHRLELDEPELSLSDNVTGIPSIDVDLINLVFTNFMTPSKDSPGIANTVRIAILDLLISNLLSTATFPTISHYLLGYNLKQAPPHVDIEDSNARSCLNAILKLFRSGTSRSKPSSPVESFTSDSPIYITHPT
jgi:nuclear pore complex protein Nup205